MQPTHRHRAPLFAAAALPALALTCCRAPLSVRESFELVQPGMSCAEVEAVLGAPRLRYCTVLPPRLGDDEAWYLEPPALGPVDAPWGPGTICVVYSVDDRVVEKRLNPQWRTTEPRLATPFWLGKREADVRRIYEPVATDSGTFFWGGSGCRTLYFAFADATQVSFELDPVGNVTAAGGPEPKRLWLRHGDGSITVADPPR
jgi:hypothetical protein